MNSAKMKELKPARSGRYEGMDHERKGIEKVLAIVGLILAALAFPLSAETMDPALIYKAASPAVIYLRYEVFVDGAKTGKKELWERFEKASGKKILGSWLTVTSGSAFFVDDQGRAITNRHVVQLDPLLSLRDAAVRRIGETLAASYGSLFDKAEREAFLKDLKAIVGERRMSAIADGREYAEIKVLAKAGDDEPDLALIQVVGATGPSVTLAVKGSVNAGFTGSDVLSLGFPLGSALDDLFKERVVTMNRGSISAVRPTEKLDIQHSAAISRGNSGGPLLSLDGRVVGVNAAILSESQGNSLFYAVGSESVHLFLEKNGYADLVLWNARLGAMADRPQGPRLNAAGEFETSLLLFVDVPPDAALKLDGVPLAERGPQVIRLDPTASKLEAEAKEASYAVALKVTPTATGSTTLRVPLDDGLVGLRIASDPPGAKAYVDGRLIGQTPVSTRFPKGAYKVTFDLEGYAFQARKIELESVGVDADAQGEPVKAFSLDGLPSRDGGPVEFNFKSGDKEFDFTEASTIALPSGSFTLSVSGIEAYKGVAIPVNTERGQTALDLRPFARNSVLSIRGLVSGAKVWIDGKEITADPTQPIPAPLGLRTVSVWKDGQLPIQNLPITIREDGMSFITWDGFPGHDRNAAIFGTSSIVMGGAGLLLVAAGNVIGLPSVAVPLSTSYDNYLQIRAGCTSAIYAGSAVAIGGAILQYFSIRERLAHKKVVEAFKPAEASR